MLEKILSSILSVCLSVVIVIQLSNFGYIGGATKFLTVDVDKIMRAHNTLIGRAAKSDFDAALSLNKVSDKVAEAIEYVSGGNVVLIAPVVASKLNNDITDEVIAYLDLPPPGEAAVELLDSLDFPDTKELEEFDASELLRVVQKHKEDRELERLRKEREDSLRQKIP